MWSYFSPSYQTYWAWFSLVGMGLIGAFFIFLGVVGSKTDRFYKEHGRKIFCRVVGFEIGTEPYFGQYTFESTIPKYIVSVKLPESDEIITLETTDRRGKRYETEKYAEIYYIDDADMLSRVKTIGKPLRQAKFAFEMNGKGGIISTVIASGVVFAMGIAAFIYFMLNR
jgi:hypothetical protein